MSTGKARAHGEAGLTACFGRSVRSRERRRGYRVAFGCCALMSVSARLAAVRGRYSNVIVWTTSVESQGPPRRAVTGVCVRALQPDGIEGVGIDVGVGGRAVRIRVKTVGWRIHADALDGPPVELHLALVHGVARADPVAEPCHRVDPSNTAYRPPAAAWLSACPAGRTRQRVAKGSRVPPSSKRGSGRAHERRAIVRIRQEDVVHQGAVPVRRRLVDPDLLGAAFDRAVPDFDEITVSSHFSCRIVPGRAASAA